LTSDWRYGYIESVGVQLRTSTGGYNVCIGDVRSEPVIQGGRGRERKRGIVIGVGVLMTTWGEKGC
jgi:hypothetical protein